MSESEEFTNKTSTHQELAIGSSPIAIRSDNQTTQDDTQNQDDAQPSSAEAPNESVKEQSQEEEPQTTIPDTGLQPSFYPYREAETIPSALPGLRIPANQPMSSAQRGEQDTLSALTVLDLEHQERRGFPARRGKMKEWWPEQYQALYWPDLAREDDWITGADRWVPGGVRENRVGRGGGRGSRRGRYDNAFRRSGGLGGWATGEASGAESWGSGPSNAHVTAGRFGSSDWNEAPVADGWGPGGDWTTAAVQDDNVGDESAEQSDATGNKGAKDKRRKSKGKGKAKEKKQDEDEGGDETGKPAGNDSGW